MISVMNNYICDFWLLCEYVSIKHSSIWHITDLQMFFNILTLAIYQFFIFNACVLQKSDTLGTFTYTHIYK